jgi:hypothetical protein
MRKTHLGLVAGVKYLLNSQRGEVRGKVVKRMEGERGGTGKGRRKKGDTIKQAFPELEKIYFRQDWGASEENGKISDCFVACSFVCLYVRVRKEKLQSEKETKTNN